MTIPFPFIEPYSALARRRHGPLGYRDYSSWLRDEHGYRCVYCLSREAWERTGADAFGVDHMVPVAKDPALALIYDNLCYACNRCNSLKRDESLLVPLVSQPLSKHLRIEPDGTVNALTKEGAYLRDLLLLDQDGRTEYRKLVLELHAHAIKDEQEGANTRMMGLFKYPEDLPDLRAARPPAGNSRSAGVEESAFSRRERGALPEFY